MASPDARVNRIVPGSAFTEPTSENFRDLSLRVCDVEQALHRTLTQWNAPWLMRGRIDEEPVADNKKDIFVQSGWVDIPYTYWVNPPGRLEYTLTFPEAFDNGNLSGQLTINNFNITAAFNQVVLQNLTSTSCLISVYLASTPTSGSVSMFWTVFGHKVFV